MSNIFFEVNKGGSFLCDHAGSFLGCHFHKHVAVLFAGFGRIVRASILGCWKCELSRTK